MYIILIIQQRTFTDFNVVNINSYKGIHPHWARNAHTSDNFPTKKMLFDMTRIRFKLTALKPLSWHGRDYKSLFASQAYWVIA